jgi:16S rRNA (adenine1518-N6/adenine1519-N6)-dimethyltransferase
MKPKPRLGQHFLTESLAIERIGSALGNLAGRTVVEIGPGRGAITRELAARAARVLAVELDRGLAASLREKFSPDRVTVIEQDILSFDFAAAFAEFCPDASGAGRLRVIGNLPYYITSPILLRLAASHAILDQALLMVQREVADRILAQPGSRDFGLLSVTVQMYGAVGRLFTLPPRAFSPPPEVHSTVFRWQFAPRFAELDVNEVSFLRFARVAFAQKRKTLVNNLRAAGISHTLAAAALADAGIPPQARAESLGLEPFASLWRFLDREGAGFGGTPAHLAEG